MHDSHIDDTRQQQHDSHNNDEIYLTQILDEMPELMEYDRDTNNTHEHQHINMHSPSNDAHDHHNDDGHDAADSNIVVLAFKLVFALIFAQLSKLHICSRIVHYLLILHVVFTLIGLSPYLSMCPTHILDDYQYWRLLTFPFADANVLMALIGCITLSDIAQRMEYHFGSVWTLYLSLLSWVLVGTLVWLTQYAMLHLTDTQPQQQQQCACIGLYPWIFSMFVIESALVSPRQTNHIFGLFYTAQMYHPFIYCVLFNALLRFDIGTIVATICSFVLVHCVPCLFHLSRHRVQQMESCTVLRCMVRDKLFISIERVDYDCFIATGKYISANCDRNAELFMLHEADRKRSPEQSFRSTVVLQANMVDSHNRKRGSGRHDAQHVDDDNADVNADPENRPFIHTVGYSHSHSHSHGHDSDISASPAVIRELNMPVNRKRG